MHVKKSFKKKMSHINWSLSPWLGTPSASSWRRQPLDMGIGMNILNKQPLTADKGWSSSLGIEQGTNNSSPLKTSLLGNVIQGLGIG
jgi:hypothetical protein